MRRSSHGRYAIDRPWFMPLAVEVWDTEAFPATPKWPQARMLRMGIYWTRRAAIRRVSELQQADL